MKSLFSRPSYTVNRRMAPLRGSRAKSPLSEDTQTDPASSSSTWKQMSEGMRSQWRVSRLSNLPVRGSRAPNPPLKLVVQILPSDPAQTEKSLLNGAGSPEVPVWRSVIRPVRRS